MGTEGMCVPLNYSRQNRIASILNVDTVSVVCDLNVCNLLILW